jgi:hypothetical protein
MSINALSTEILRSVCDDFTASAFPLDDKKLYALRRCIELFFGRIKENRRLAVHYEKTDLCFLGFIACAILKAFYFGQQCLTRDFIGYYAIG